MASFNENLGNFLTECRNTALDELAANKNYTACLHNLDILKANLTASISGGAKEIFDDYIEQYISLQSMEYNKILLYGLALTANIQRRFDPASPEYQAFVHAFQSEKVF